ncbi:MAG: hypothetical protein ABII02_04070 [Candidatus Magasanikbacteria bacterium]
MKKYKSILLIALAIGSILSIAMFFVIRFVFAFSWTSVVLETTGIDHDTGRSIAAVMQSTSITHLAYCAYLSGGTDNMVNYAVVNSGVTSTELINRTVNVNCNERNIDIAYGGSSVYVMFTGSEAADDLYLALRNGNGSGTCDNNEWNCYEISTTTYDTKHISMKLYDRGGVLLAFQDDTNDNLGYGYCASRCYDYTNWSFEIVDSTSTIMARGVDLALLSDGTTPVIAYNDITRTKIKYAIRNGSGSGNCTDTDWNCYEVDDAHATNGDTVAVAIDDSDRIGIVYAEKTSQDLRFALKDGGNTGCTGDQTSSFTCEEADGGATIYVQYPSMIFRGSVPLIAWERSHSSDTELVMSYKSEGSWTNEIVDNRTTFIGSYASIDRYGDDVSIGYYDSDADEAMHTTAGITFTNAPSISVTISTTTPNGDQTTEINLSEGVTTSVYVYGVITDADGCEDVDESSLKLTFYRSGMTSSTLCFEDDENCYQLREDNNSCDMSGCSGSTDNTSDYTCTVPVEYFADPTDAGTYSAENWIASVRISGEVDGLSATTTQSTEINSLSSLGLSATIDYGTLVFGTTSTEDAVLVVTNFGNTSIDLEVAGTDFSCTTGSVAVDLQRFSSSSGVSYEDMYQSVSSGLEYVGFDLAPQTVSTTAATSGLYFKIYTTSSLGLAGSCTGSTSIMATLDI